MPNPNSNPKANSNSKRLRGLPESASAGQGNPMPYQASTGGFVAGRMPTTMVEHTNRPAKRSA